MTATKSLDGVPTPLSAAFKAAIGGREIEHIEVGGQYWATGGWGMIMLTTDHEVFTLGNPHLNGRGEDVTVYGTPYHLTGNGPLKGKKIFQIYSAWGNVGALDSEGNVWAWGLNRWGILAGLPYSDSYNDFTNLVMEPTLMYSGGDAHYILSVAQSGLVLTKDNRIMQTVSSNPAAQAYQAVTQNDTVLACADAENAGYLFLTKAGNKYATGNACGWAGTGSTGGITLDTPVTEAGDIPMPEPISKNQISMEVVTTDPDGNIHKYSSWSTESGIDLNNLTIRAGQRLRVDIYMEDFAKINAFQIPLSFEPEYLQVVDNSGKKYSQEAEIHPGFNSESGIKTKIPTKTYNPESSSTIWQGGTLTENAYMPVVDNMTGYVTVIGDATASDKMLHAKIEGKQLMYSIEFTGIAQTPTGTKTGFSIESTKDPTWPRPAQWQSLRANESVKNTGFDFKDPDFVTFALREVKLEDLDLNLLRDETYIVTDKSPETGESDYYLLDKRNTESTYTIASIATPSDASFPDVESWTVEAVADKEMNEGATISDYITVLSQLDDPSSLEFRIESSIAYNDKVMKDDAFVPAYIKVTAHSTRIPNKDGKPAKMREIYIKIADNVPAPETLVIANKGTAEGEFNDPNGIAGVFKANATSSTAFSSNFRLDVDYSFTFKAAFTGSEEGFSKDVTWQLLRVTKRDENGDVAETTPLGTDTSAAVVISTTGTLEDKTPTCTVQAQHSMEADEDVVLKLSSSVDPTVCDYVPISVQLAPYEIKYPVETVTLVYGSGMKQQYDLTTNLQVSPMDAMGYTVEYDTDVKTYGRANADVQVVVNTRDGVTSAVIDPIRADAEFNATWYDEVTVRAKTTVNGQTLTLERKLKVYTIDAVPPENMYVQGINAAGDDRDYIRFTIDKNKSQLAPGDKITIFPDYTTTVILEGYNNRTLTQADIDLMWGTGIKVPGGLNDAGGTLGYILERTGESPSAKTPVTYDPAAIKISGFIRLDGKLANSSANNGITVTLEGVKGADGRTLSTLTKSDGSRYGFFEFDQYVPATTHNLIISKTNYLTRNVAFQMTKTDHFEVSTYENPILLFPGDLDGKRGIQYDDANEYRINFVGRYLKRGEVSSAVFDTFNFVDEDAGDTPAINVWDIALIQKRITYQTSDYPAWTVE